MSLSKENIKPKYCKVCHDTGKDEKTYTSHYVRETPDPTSRIVCPTLLDMSCKYCYKKGHTVKHCKVIKNRAQEQQRAARIKMNNETNKTVATNVSQNMYDLLDDCEEDDEVNMETSTNHTPHMFSPRSPTSTPPPLPVTAPLSYAKIIKITHKQLAEQEMDRIRKEAEDEKRKEAEDEKRKREQQVAAPYFNPIKITKMLNWANDTSSDEEYVYFEYDM